MHAIETASDAIGTRMGRGLALFARHGDVVRDLLEQRRRPNLSRHVSVHAMKVMKAPRLDNHVYIISVVRCFEIE